MSVRDFNPSGPLNAGHLDVVELSFGDIDFLRLEGDILELSELVGEDTGVRYTVHAPYQNSQVEHLRVNLGEECTLKLLEKALHLAWRIGAEYVVVHPGDARCRHSFTHSVRNLRRLGEVADRYGIFLVVENVFTDERGVRRVGELPHELLRLCEEAATDNLGVCVDVGHAYISSLLHGFEVRRYFELLGHHLLHLHIHNNHGIRGAPWDEHLPLFQGDVDYISLRHHLRARNVVLEVKRGCPEGVYRSLEFLRGGVRALRRYRSGEASRTSKCAEFADARAYVG